MKLECDIVKDLLPLYAEDMISAQSKTAVEKHLLECADCASLYEHMVQPEPQLTLHTNPQASYKKYVKKKKRDMAWKLVGIALIFGVVLMLAHTASMSVSLNNFIQPLFFTGVMEDTDINHYSLYMGEDAEAEYRNKLDMDESIFPEEITENMTVTDYKMVSYSTLALNKIQYVSYLAVSYDDAAYHREIERLMNCPQDDYVGYYGAEGFEDAYELLAMYSHASRGFVYALAAENNTIIYVELIFSHHYIALDYEKYISSTYLPLGFDASPGNPYGKEMQKLLK